MPPPAEWRTSMNDQADVRSLLMWLGNEKAIGLHTKSPRWLDEAETLAANPKEKESVYSCAAPLCSNAAERGRAIAASTPTVPQSAGIQILRAFGALNYLELLC